MDEFQKIQNVGRVYEDTKEGVLFNEFLFDEKNKLQDILNAYGDGRMLHVDVQKGATIRIAYDQEYKTNFPEIKQRLYWVRHSSKVLSNPDIWTMKKAQEEWDKIRTELQKDWNIRKSYKNVYIHFRRWQQFDFWWVKWHIGKRIRFGYYKGSPQVVTFILKESEIRKMTKKMEDVSFTDRIKDVMRRKRIPLHDKIQPIKDKRNEYFVPPKFVIDPEIVLQYY
jgi:hypothetical protein